MLGASQTTTLAFATTSTGPQWLIATPGHRVTAIISISRVGATNSIYRVVSALAGWAYRRPGAVA